MRTSLFSASWIMAGMRPCASYFSSEMFMLVSAPPNIARFFPGTSE
jgi:hypothetical protein